jgi:hypothetical protein
MQHRFPAAEWAHHSRSSPAGGATDDDVAAGPQQPARRPQRRVLVVHEAKACIEEHGIGGALGCRQVDDVAAPRPHLLLQQTADETDIKLWGIQTVSGACPIDSCTCGC